MASQSLQLTLEVNGEERSVSVPPLKRLLDVLREDFGLTGTKEGCGEGECGACSVVLNGELINSCLVPASQGQGATVMTVEGLARAKTLRPLQACFVKYGGSQCGICTPGMLIAAQCFLDRKLPATEVAIREAIAGNLCRCTGYAQIVESVQAAASEERK